MSILNGNTSARVIFPEVPHYGKPMTPASSIDEPSVAVASLGDDILLCGGEKLSLYRVSDDGTPTPVSSLPLCGKARQIAVKDGYAYVTARENGVYVCDLRNVEDPKLLYNIDTVELATGIAVAENILAVTSRHMGCELFDLSVPEMPRRLAHFLCGEAQSVCLYGHYAVIGDWMNKRARLFDLADMENIKELSQMYVDGFADGVCTFEKDGRTYCAVATGHHSARLKNRRKYDNYAYVTAEMLAEGYGCGHGVEIFDVTDPLIPAWVSAVKAPPLFGGLDTWLVFTDGQQIVFTDSMNGVFVLSLDDIYAPAFVNRYKLPPLARQRFTPPSIQLQTGAITSAALVKGYLCTASDQNGVQLMKPDRSLGTFLPQKVEIGAETVTPSDEAVFYRSTGQIHAFAAYNDRVYCASGNAGIEVLDRSGKLLFRKETPGVCRDILLCGGRLICAESGAGIAVYRIDENLAEESRYPAQGASIRQVVATKNGVAAVAGVSEILFLKIGEDGALTLCAKHRIAGILYHRHLAPGPAGVDAVANPLSVGATLLTEDGGMVGSHIVFDDTHFCPFSDGSCGYENRLIAVCEGNYYAIGAPFDQLEGKTVAGASLDGQPFIAGRDLVLLNRYTGGVEVFDVTDPDRPLLKKSAVLNSHPEFCAAIDGRLYAACGFDGIVEI